MSDYDFHLRELVKKNTEVLGQIILALDKITPSEEPVTPGDTTVPEEESLFSGK